MNNTHDLLENATIDQLDNLLEYTNEWYKLSKKDKNKKFIEAIKMIDIKRYSILNEVSIGKSNKSIHFAIAPSRNKSYDKDAYFKVFRKGNRAQQGIPCWRIFIFRAEYETKHTPMERKPLNDSQKEELAEFLVDHFNDPKHYNAVLLEIQKEAKLRNIELPDDIPVINWQGIIYFFNTLTNDREYISYFTPIPDYKTLPDKY